MGQVAAGPSLSATVCAECWGSEAAGKDVETSLTD